ncbi:uncharacterized protein LOC129568921 [Sitodiplosis mosellana]|uniref:uncharacterized protein LOC129568921 n=1 Tax=Sitodiplosis mosellana TaxID=263140 RepID=UPI002443C8F8|nr:uncharacterized protein LOC129568921 [Sitodiplosis mosellana]
MSDQNEKLSRKRRKNERDELRKMKREAKRLKAKATEEVTEASIPTIKITDLNNDCLEVIFNHLEFNDLFNVADSNKLLTSAAGRVYWKKYRKMPVDLYTCYTTDECFKIRAHCIWVYDRTAALKFLRYFGHIITKLRITCFSIKNPYLAELHRYVFEYCSETLIQISFCYMIACAFFPIEKSFPNVESVSFRYCMVDENLSQLNKWFPNVRRLTFGYFVKLDNRKCIEKYFPHLQSLSIERFCPQNQFGFEEQNAMEALRLNPNLQHLKLKNFDTKFLRKASEYMKRVESLEITIRRSDINHRGSSIRLEKVKRLVIHGDRDQHIDFSTLPFTFGCVHEVIYIKQK